jgi:peptide/nickel transport system permease protein
MRLRRAAAIAVPVALAAVAVFGPLMAPYAEDMVVGAPFATPGSSTPFGTDTLGRDVFSRFLNGGDKLLLTAAIAAVVGTTAGSLLGLFAAVIHPFTGRVLERGTEVLLVLPSLLVLILVGTAAPDPGPLPLAALLAVLATPWVARVVAAAAAATLRAGYVEHAVATGESIWWIITREIAPGLRGTLLATLGLRFVEAMYLVAGAAFLGIGVQPPEADWAVMIRENASGLLLNPWAALFPCVAIGMTAIVVSFLCDRCDRTAQQGTRA